ncbi:MAG: C4-dicarboxylate ABC transporter permease, partial [Caldisphaera sp.]
SQLRGFIGGAIGILIGCIGIAPIGGDVRYTFGIWQLQGGIELVSSLIGLFAIPQVLETVKEEKIRIGKITPYKHKKGVLKEVIKYAFKKPYLIIRSALIGIIIGIKPGAGGNIAGIISYNEAVRWSKEPEKFGTGVLEGVLAPDTATGAEVGGSLIPLLALGIPSAPPTAVLIGALLSHPELFKKYGNIVYPFLFGFLIANIVLFFLAIYLPRVSSKLVNIPRYFLIPLIVFLCVVGSYSIRNSIFDVYIMVIIGLIGYLLKKFDITAGPLVLGLILGPIMERALIQSMLLVKSGESIVKVFFGNLISIFLVLLCILALIWPFISKNHSLNSKEGKK